MRPRAPDASLDGERISSRPPGPPFYHVQTMGCIAGVDQHVKAGCLVARLPSRLLPSLPLHPLSPPRSLVNGAHCRTMDTSSVYVLPELQPMSSVSSFWVMRRFQRQGIVFLMDLLNKQLFPETSRVQRVLTTFEILF